MQHPNVSDVINDCAYIVSFLDTAIGTFPSREQITLSYEATNGLSLILGNISQRLFASASAIETREVRP